MRKLVYIVVFLVFAFLFYAALHSAHAQGAGTKRGVGATVTQLGVVSQTLLPAFPNRIVQWCVIVGGAADEEVIFRAVDDTPEYRRETVAAGAKVVVPISAQIPPGGLEVLTASA